MVAVAQRGTYPEVVSVQPLAPDATSDKSSPPADIWHLYGPHWRATLDALAAEDTIVFNTETTGVEPELDEAVSIKDWSITSRSPMVIIRARWKPWRGNWEACFTPVTFGR